MASSGPNSPATAVDDNSYGVLVWSNPSNVYSNDGAYAKAESTGPNATHYLKVTNFGFAIPSGATIDGIIVAIEKLGVPGSSPNGVRDSRIRIIKGGTVQSTDLADTSTWWPGTDTYVGYGSPTELWGTTWTDTDINSSNFGVAISAYCNGIPGKLFSRAWVDHVRIVVYYTVGGGGGSSVSKFGLLGVG